jgi:hypothetical protein
LVADGWADGIAVLRTAITRPSRSTLINWWTYREREKKNTINKADVRKLKKK